MLKKQDFPIADVRIPAKRKRTLVEAKVQELAEDILENGQTTPIRVRSDKDKYILIEGYHRLEAMRALGEETVEGYLVQARVH